MLEHPLVVLFPEVRHELGVAARGEEMAPGFERPSRLGVVEQLAVEDGHDAAVLVGDRLMTVGEVDDAEPAIRQGHAITLEVAFVVGSAMHDGIRHAVHAAGRDRLAVTQIHDPGDPAHAVDATLQLRPLKGGARVMRAARNGRVSLLWGRSAWQATGRWRLGPTKQ